MSTEYENALDSYPLLSMIIFENRTLTATFFSTNWYRERKGAVKIILAVRKMEPEFSQSLPEPFLEQYGLMNRIGGHWETAEREWRPRNPVGCRKGYLVWPP